MTPSEIKNAYESVGGNRHFFERATMKFFGDTMKSYGSRTIDGKVFLYRKPTASVNVFGKWKMAGRQFFSAWRFENGDLHLCRGEEAEQVWNEINK